MRQTVGEIEKPWGFIELLYNFDYTESVYGTECRVNRNEGDNVLEERVMVHLERALDERVLWGKREGWLYSHRDGNCMSVCGGQRAQPGGAKLWWFMNTPVTNASD